MGLIDALYIADDKGQLVFEYSLRSSTPGYHYIASKLRYADGNQGANGVSLSSFGNEKGNCFISGLDPVLELESDLYAAWKQTGSIVVIIVGTGYKSPVDVVYDKSDETEEESDGTEEESEESEEEAQASVDSQSREHAEETIVTRIHPTYNPLLYLNFINRVIAAMEQFLGSPVLASKIESHSETLVLLLQEMLDAEYPYITDLNQLKDLMPKTGILKSIFDTTKMISETAQKSFTRNDGFPGRPQASIVPQSSATRGTGNGSVWEKSGSATPWRRGNVKYTNNEMYVDLTETVSVIVPPKGKSRQSKKIPQGSAFYSSSYLGSQITTKNFTKPIMARIDGQIDFTSKVSGVPSLLLQMSLGRHDMGVPAFHRCVKLSQWLSSPGTLSFVPPDGKFRLMSYSIDLLANASYADNPRELSSYLGLVHADFTVGLGLSGNEFEIQLNTTNYKSVKGIEDLKVEIVTENKDDDSAYLLRSLRMTHGDLRMTEKGTYEWVFDKLLALGVNPSFRGALLSESADSNNPTDDEESKHSKQPKRLQPKYIRMSYNNKGMLASGIKVDALQIVSAQGLDSNVKPYKGVKYITKTGDFVLR